MMKQGVAAAAAHRDIEEDGEGRRVSSSEIIHGEEDNSCFINGRMSADSQDFEFDKLGGLTSSASSQTQCSIEAEGVQQLKLASADELFYKGQLLPLQYSRSRSPSCCTHSLTSSPIAHLEDLLRAASSCPPVNSAQLPQSASLIRDQDTRFSSCRMDALDHSCLFELTRSSSFRSHSANYSSYYCNYDANYGPPCSNYGSRWDSFPSPSCTTTSGGECSSSSSRDSNGSSQDSCISCPDACTREQHAGCSRHGQLHAPAVVNRPCNTQRKPGFMQSWKSLFHGFKRGTQSAGALGNYQSRHNPSFHGSLSCRAATTAANQGAGAAAACVCKVSKEKACMVTDQVSRSSSRNTGSLIKANQVISSADHKIITADSSKKDDEDHQERKGAASAAMKGSRWQDYTRRIKPIIKATWQANQARVQTMVDRGHGSSTAGNGSRSDHQQEVAGDQTRVRVATQAIPLQRKFSQPSLVSTVSGAKERFKVQVSFKFHGAGAVSRSCPASVKSSPNHSGLLVAASPSSLFPPNMSAMQELHSAVQSAIAHCKQSVAAAPPSTS